MISEGERVVAHPKLRRDEQNCPVASNSGGPVCLQRAELPQVRVLSLDVAIGGVTKLGRRRVQL